MDYIILNGKSSKLVGGLMIQTLPPITKPQMRTEIEDIDGRDGDIITKLGYASYNKTIEIGLYGKYDVDEVIKYFDSEGTVIFSNELGKYYRYSIIDQIDFEKLIRFKTATVEMHVQPFKYSAVDQPVVTEEMFSIPDQDITESGVTVTCDGGTISVSGTATEGIEVFVPIDDLYCRTGNYTIKTTSSGDNCDAVAVRVVSDNTMEAVVLTNNMIVLDGSDQSVTGLVPEPETFKYIWMHFDPNVAIDMSFSVSVLALQIHIYNMGNTISRPLLTLYGSGDMGIYVNGIQVFAISDLTSGSITFDSENMEAYKGDTLLNRKVFGDYNKLVLKTGLNIISWAGNVTKAVVDRYSRWI